MADNIVAFPYPFCDAELNSMAEGRAHRTRATIERNIETLIAVLDLLDSRYEELEPEEDCSYGAEGEI